MRAESCCLTDELRCSARRSTCQIKKRLLRKGMDIGQKIAATLEGRKTGTEKGLARARCKKNTACASERCRLCTQKFLTQRVRVPRTNFLDARQCLAIQG
jgi:hypothetical protein